MNDQVGWWGYVERVIGECFKWVNVCRGNGLWEEVGYMGALGNRDCPLASSSVLKDFTDDALTISAGSLFQNETARMLKAYWLQWAQHLC